RVISAAARESCSRSASPRAANTPTAPISSLVTTSAHPLESDSRRGAPPEGSGTGTRTPNSTSRVSRVANYTIPDRPAKDSPRAAADTARRPAFKRPAGGWALAFAEPVRSEVGGDRVLEAGVEHQQHLITLLDHGVGFWHEPRSLPQHRDDQAAF